MTNATHFQFISFYLEGIPLIFDNLTKSLFVIVGKDPLSHMSPH